MVAFDSPFQTARKSDYEKIIQDASLLLIDWSSGKIDPKEPAVRGSAQVSKLHRRLNEVAAIDFFNASERGTAEILIKDLAARLSGEGSDSSTVKDKLEKLNCIPISRDKRRNDITKIPDTFQMFIEKYG